MSSVVSRYESSLDIMSAQMRTRKRCLHVCHGVIVPFLTSFLCVQNIGETFSTSWTRSLLCVRLRCFLSTLFLIYDFFSFYLFLVMDYLHDRMPNEKYPGMICPMDVIKCECLFCKF